MALSSCLRTGHGPIDTDVSRAGILHSVEFHGRHSPRRRRVLVNKLSYRFGDIQRGDVIVFSKPDGAPGEINDFIKRVIALPGETIAFSNGQVLIDGEPYNEPYVDFTRTFVNGRLMDCANEPASADQCLIPKGTVFVMGDNREGSTDSRTFGPVEIDSIVGRAFIKLWPLGDIGFL